MYTAPVGEILFTLQHVAGMAGDGSDPLDETLAAAILTEAGRFASNEIAPLAATGDRAGATLADGVVTAPPGWAALYRAWAAAGWNGLGAPEAHGGQGLPHRLHVAAMEMWNSGSMAFALAPILTTGAIEAIDRHATDALKALYLPKMVSGEWTGTMNLTEPQAGSDLGALSARAERRTDGSYRLFGQKIFITWGEHDLTENIVHLVLARLPDAPEGTRGISLFLVPKFLPNAEGRPGARNDLFCHAIERKLGIHGSPTCTMIFGDGRFGAEKGAVGYLVGEEHRGLACMFTMMNNARLTVGTQGVAIAEVATQKALAYARERRQGRAGGEKGGPMSPIVAHPDIARTLLLMKALTQGARAITYACADAIDRAGTETGDRARFWQGRAGLMTPIAKAFATDVGVDVASMGIQVHGGMGFIEETGAARLYRDARIAPIYEGTNGIQAIDLVTRKLTLEGGGHVRDFIAGLAGAAGEGRLGEAVRALSDATEHLLALQAAGRPEEALAVATPYLRLFGLVLSGVYLTRGGSVDAGDGRQAERQALARFAVDWLLPETSALRAVVTGGAGSLDAARFLLA
ncbi:acyl-CoA dehydrogenase [Ensifer soli]|uniref:acyl-CoA dehydrogenase n=1 Tax=Ciceribacter sp. sgz301302 TaxID=3342379 RepID=UPI0035B7E045